MAEFFVRWSTLCLEALSFPWTYWFYEYPYRKRLDARLNGLREYNIHDRQEDKHVTN